MSSVQPAIPRHAHFLPRFSVMKANYPDPVTNPTKALLDWIGGDVRSLLADNVNTCALRLSVALNASGRPIKPTAGVFTKRGVRDRTGRSLLYVLRASEMKTYLKKNHGHGHLIFDGRSESGRRSPTHGVGIVVFEWLGMWSGFKCQRARGSGACHTRT